MRIKTQLLISIIAFIAILVIIGSSVAFTQLQISQLSREESVARDIQTGASNLNYISNNYFLYQSNDSIALWQTELATLSGELAQLNSTNSRQQTLVNTVNDDMSDLDSVFNGVITFLNNAPRNQSVRILPAFQTQWNRMAVQIQALSFDAQQLSQSIQDQTNQAIFTNTALTVVLMAVFGVFFVAIYLLNSRRVLNSISELKTGLRIIGSGNLDRPINAGNKDEIADISKSVNQMTANLKAVTASKTELEKEIDERKKAEEALKESEEQARQRAEELQKLMDIVPAAIWISNDPECKVIVGNQTANNFYEAGLGENVSAGPASGVEHDTTRRFYQNGRELLPQELPMQEAALKNREIKNSELEVRTPSGKTMTMFGSAKPLVNNDGKVRGCLGTFIDITERKKAEKKIEDYSKNLERIVEERTKQLKDAERLAAIGATAGMVGHDIRNPLHAMTGDVFLAKSDIANLPDSEEKKSLKESLDSIEENIFYINKIVADLQDYARPLRPHTQETDLKAIIEKVLSEHGIPENVEATFKVDKEAQILTADSDYLKRIVSNLALNAVQAMPTGGKLAIHAFKDNQTGDNVITVTDSGVGIPADVQEKLFTPMFTTKSKGQGFGLAVVKRLTESLGGSVTFESEVDRGTTFTVRLPRKALSGKPASF